MRHSSTSDTWIATVAAVERAVDRSPDGLTYALPRELAQLADGARVEVPLGRGETPTAGWIVRRIAAGEDIAIPCEKAGHVHGATDDFGYSVVDGAVDVHDLHATILHLMGVDHERLTYRDQRRHFRLTDVAGKVVAPILA